MATIKRIEKRQRGFFGWVFLLIFWAFNALMAVWMIAGINVTAEGAGALASEAEKAGHAIGSAIGMGMIVSVWMAGAVILGIFVLLTRGKKTIIETTES